MQFYPHKLILDDIRHFDAPIRIGPLVSTLEFVTNKTHRGHAVRSSPRFIPLSDFRKIVAAATSAQAANVTVPTWAVEEADAIFRQTGEALDAADVAQGATKKPRRRKRAR
jgi:hypothetical protein